MQRRVAAGQILAFPSPQASAEKIVHWMELAAADGVDAVAFPEAAIRRYAAAPKFRQAARLTDPCLSS